MKKIVILFAIVLCSKNYAQLSKGKIMLGCSGNYWQQDDNNKIDSLTRNISNSVYSYVSFNFGYAISNNIVVGINMFQQNSRYRYSNETGVDTNLFKFSGSQKNVMHSAGLFLRYYKMINKGKFGLYYQLNANYGRGFQRSSSFTYNNTLASYQSGGTSNKGIEELQLTFNPGIIYFITNKIGIETSFGSIGYTMAKNTFYLNDRQTGSGKTSDFSTSFDLSTFRFGINFYLGGKKESKEPAK